MTLLAMVLALIAERVLSHLQHWREHALFARHVAWLQRRLAGYRLWNSPWLLGVLFVPGVAGVALTQWLLDDVAHGTLSFVFAVLVLLITLGPRDLAEEVRALLAARERQDTETADRITEDLLRTPSRLTDSCRSAERRSVVAAICIQAHERVFAVLIWFFVLGPVGAVAYRMVSAAPRLLFESGDCPRAVEPAVRLHAIAAWVPARITQLLYALAGSTDDAFSERRRVVQTPAESWVADTWRQLAVVGVGALNVEEDNSGPIAPGSLEAALEAVLALRGRALLVLLAALALPTIGGWLA